MAAADAHGAIDAVWRIESPRLIAALARAASLTHNDRDRALLLARAAHCDGGISA